MNYACSLDQLSLHDVMMFCQINTQSIEAPPWLEFWSLPCDYQDYFGREIFKNPHKNALTSIIRKFYMSAYYVIYMSRNISANELYTVLPSFKANKKTCNISNTADV